MIVNLDLLRIYLDHQEGMDTWERHALLGAAMPLVGNTAEVWLAVRDSVTRLRALDSASALEHLKDQGRIGGGHDPQTAFNIVASEIELEIVETIGKVGILATGRTVTTGVAA